MKFENIKVYNIENAIRGMRNPLESWAKSDSFFGVINLNESEVDYDIADEWVRDKYNPNYPTETNEELDKAHYYYDRWLIDNGMLDVDYDHDCAVVAFIGPNDMDLAKRLINAGPEHRKFLRQIMVSVDITAPIFWWKEFDTYKIGTTANSTSTMHKLTSKPITLDCFETGDYCPEVITSGEEIDYLIQFLEGLRQKYVATKDKRYWKELVRWLPESWLQTRTVTMNYENLRTMYSQRKNHKLLEWSKTGDANIDSFVKFVEKLPYAKEFLIQ